MKKFTLIKTLILCLFLTSATAMFGQNKREIRANYVINHLGLNNDQKKKLKPLLISYLNELHNATDPYENKKDALKNNIKNNKLSDKEADALLNAKWSADAKEANIKKNYSAKFKSIIGAKKTWYCFSLLNDKMSKITGQEKKK